MSFDFAVIGGDLRFSYLAKLLHQKNYRIIGFELCKLPKNNSFQFQIANSLQEAIENSSNIICPIPFSRNDKLITSVNENSVLKIKNFINLIKKFKNKNRIVFAGGLSNKIKEIFEKSNIKFYDYLSNQSFAVFNAALTAEAAIAQTILNNAIALNFSSCIVLGFGKCGKLLALKLKMFCKKIVIAARSEIDLAWAQSLGFETLKLNELKLKIHEFNFVFNTIPFNFLTGNVLQKFNKKTFVFDITSNGINLNEFQKNKILAVRSLQIPGKFKFKSSSKLLLNSIEKVLEF